MKNIISVAFIVLFGFLLGACQPTIYIVDGSVLEDRTDFLNIAISTDATNDVVKQDNSRQGKF